MAASNPKLDILDGKNGTQSGQFATILIGPTLEPTSNPATKSKDGQSFLDLPLHDSFRPSLDTLSGSSICSINENDSGTGRSLRPNFEQTASRSTAAPRAWRSRWEAFWQRNKGLALVLLAQFFGGLMNVSTRLLEITDSNGPAMSPFQILFVRMGITTVCCMIYMWWAKVKNAPFGKQDIQHLLVIRGLTGFMGVYGIYYSLIYLPIAEAVVITFLAPIITCWACSLLIHEPFTRIEQIAAFLSLIGVVMIAQPTSFSGLGSSSTSNAQPSGLLVPSSNTTVPSSNENGIPEVTPWQRFTAVAVGLGGTIGAAGAYTTIRWIGKRAHPLISVNYFATWCTIVSAVVLIAVPGVDFRLPSSPREWSLLAFLGICGFVMQFLLTAGLAHEKSSRATQMVYTQMLFALAFDKIIWDSTPGLWSLVGSSLILGSALFVAVKGEAARASAKAKAAEEDEEVGLMANDELENDAEDDNDDSRGPLRGVQEVQLRTLRV